MFFTKYLSEAPSPAVSDRRRSRALDSIRGTSALELTQQPFGVQHTEVLPRDILDRLATSQGHSNLKLGLERIQRELYARRPIPRQSPDGHAA